MVYEKCGVAHTGDTTVGLGGHLPWPPKTVLAYANV
jgi:hypothetical protein